MSSKKELLEILEDSTYIYKRNMVNRYQIRLYENFVMHCSSSGISWNKSK